MPPETGISAAARAVDRQVSEAASRGTALLIRGATGLGKLRLARRVHDLSDRKAAPLVVCNALRETVSPGDVQTAVNAVGEGTLVVIGIGRLDGLAQDALMTELAAPRFRLIATLGLQGEEDAHGLRGDLMSLLRSHEIVVPALADRPDDAVWLAAQLFPGLNARRTVALTGIAAIAEEAIRLHDWPGNGREVRARLMRAVEAAEGEMVLTSDLFPDRAAEEGMRSLAEVRDAAERAQIVVALDRTGGQVGEAAKLLRVSRTTLWEKMQKLGL